MLPVSDKGVAGGLTNSVIFTIAFSFLKENYSAASCSILSIWKSRSSSTLEEDSLEYILIYF